MSNHVTSPGRWGTRDLLEVGARCILGGILLYMGLNKALHPVDFLKVLRQYEMIESHLGLNLIASLLPWFECFCGLLLLTGIAVRGAALTSLAMLVPFSLIVLSRALAVQKTQAIAFCSVSFDCGCGAGEVVICHKLVENGVLILLSLFLLLGRPHRGCLRYQVLQP